MTPDDLNLKILDCGGGPSSFNAKMTKRGMKVISIDPIYNLSADDIEIRINETSDDVIYRFIVVVAMLIMAAGIGVASGSKLNFVKA